MTEGIARGRRLPGGALLLGMLALALGIAATPVVGSLLAKQKVARAYDEAHVRVVSGKHEEALSLLDLALDGGRRSRPRLEDLALLAAGARAEEIENEQGAKAALEWLTGEVARKPYLDPLRRSRMPRLETVVEMRAAHEKGENLELPLRRLLEKYPEDPAVAYAGARILQEAPGGDLDANALQYYEMALERGGYARDQRIWALVVDTWENSGPGDRRARDAHRIARKHYPEDRMRWAEKAYDGAEGPSRLNAMTILDESGDPRTKDVESSKELPR